MRSLAFSTLVLSLLAVSARAGTIDGFAVLGASTVTNTGPTTIKGNIGLSPGSSVTGLGSITLTGVVDVDNLAAVNGQIHALAAYSAWLPLSTQPSGSTDLSGDDLGALGHALVPGVYRSEEHTSELQSPMYL